MRHIELLNAFLALRFKQPGFPCCLAELGYSIDSIGVKGVLPDGTTVHPDVIASARDRTLTLLVEVKSGATIDGDQLRRMLRVTPVDLRDSLYLYVPDPVSHRVQIVYVCDDAHRSAVTAQLAEAPAAIIGFDGSRFQLSGAALADLELTSCLVRAEVSPAAIPLEIIPFDNESKEHDVARAILPHIVDAWFRGSGVIRPEELVAQTHRIIHPQMQSTSSGSEHRELVQVVKRVLEGISKGELREWLVRVPSQPAAWRFCKGLPADSSRTRELQKLQRAAQDYLGSVGGGRPVQLTLFSEEAETPDR